MIEWHIITGEYPPALGGVADYTAAVAAGLGAAGDVVHVWCPSPGGSPPRSRGVEVHPILGRTRPADLRRLGRGLGAFSPARRILVQWVPHAFGYRSMNVPLCLWVRGRARRGDRIELMVHEAFLAFRQGSWKQDAAAAVHRLMTVILLGAASHVWVAIPAWERALRPYALGRRLSFACLPVPSNIPVITDRAGVEAVRAVCSSDTALVGHFSTYPRAIMPTLARTVPRLLSAGLDVMLLGRDSEGARRRLLPACSGGRASQLHAAGTLSAADLSRHLQACDLLMQPYAEGVTGRRGTIMAALAHGRPVVTTIGRFSEPFWARTPGVAAVQAGDDGALESAVMRLAGRPDERAVLGREARVLYQARFDISHTITRLRAGTDQAAACESS